MKQEFENYEHLEPIPRVYGYGGALVSFLVFICVHPVVKRFGTPASIAERNRWKWQNILISWIHSVIIGVWVLSSFYFYPEATKDLMTFHNPVTYGAVAFSTGYFISDFLDIIISRQVKSNWEVQLHHVAVLSIFLYNLTLCRYISYTNVALLVEVHSISLHLRKMMQMAGVSFQNLFYRINNIINILMFLGFRMFAIVWITKAMIWQNKQMSTVYMYLLAATMFVMWIINLTLFWRLVKSDFLRNIRKHRHTENGKCQNVKNDNNNKSNEGRHKSV